MSDKKAPSLGPKVKKAVNPTLTPEALERLKQNGGDVKKTTMNSYERDQE